MSDQATELPEEPRYIPLDDPTKVWSSYDLGVAAALLCAGFELMTVDKEHQQKSLFIFKKGDGIDEVANQYLADRLDVKARKYFDCLRALKNALYR
ncbi:MAG: DUF5659 domain-containing protein [bacterium]